MNEEYKKNFGAKNWGKIEKTDCVRLWANVECQLTFSSAFFLEI